MIWWTGLSPWSLNSLLQVALHLPSCAQDGADSLKGIYFENVTDTSLDIRNQLRVRVDLSSPSTGSLASALEATQGQMDGFFSQLPYKCHLNEVASVGD